MKNEFELDVPIGLRGTRVEKTKISSCDPNRGLNYYGYPIEYLAFACEFEEVMYLLQYGNLPKEEEYKSYKHKILKYFDISDELKNYLNHFPKNAKIINVIRSVINYLSIKEPEKNDFSNTDELVIKTITTITISVIYWKNLSEGKELLIENKMSSFASKFLYLINGEEPSEKEVKAFNCLLILYAEHELNASTYTAIVSASTKSDYYSVILSAYGTFLGPIHGGACAVVMQQLEEFLNNDILKTVEYKLSNHEKIYGFGHGGYGVLGDPRTKLMKYLTKELISENNSYEVIEKLENIMKEKMKNLPANVDLYASILMRYFNLKPDYATALIFISRLNGISAHIKEKREEKTLIRPRALYIGETKTLDEILSNVNDKYQKNLICKKDYKLITKMLEEKYCNL